MPQTMVDRRVQKTRKLLEDALIELVAEKGYETITVQEILDKANVGRSTFYVHFQSKDHLLHHILDRLNELFEQHKSQLQQAVAQVKTIDNAVSTTDLAPTLPLFQLVGENHRFFKALLTNRGHGVFARPIYTYLVAYMHEQFSAPTNEDVTAHRQGYFKMKPTPEKQASLEAEIAAHYFASAFMGLIVWWVEQDMPCSAAEIDRLFRELAGYGFRPS